MHFKSSARLFHLLSYNGITNFDDFDFTYYFFIFNADINLSAYRLPLFHTHLYIKQSID